MCLELDLGVFFQRDTFISSFLGHSAKGSMVGVNGAVCRERLEFGMMLMYLMLYFCHLSFCYRRGEIYTR
jgi:hypothetical protein